MEKSFIEVKSNGTVKAKNGKNKRNPYEHQRKAIENLDIIDKLDDYSTLIVLPTGGGKTYTASLWLLKAAINKHKKILWIAHRQTLLDQAAESFQKYAYAEYMPKVSSFKYRIVSGSVDHDRTIDIVSSDNLLIASKDSLGRNLQALDSWLKGEEEVYLVIDEAHHSTAKTYRKVIDYVKSKVRHVKIIGLTATPFRTADSEQGLLAKIYTDGVNLGKSVKGNKGITYKTDLKTLINRGILSRPIFEYETTDKKYGGNLGKDDLERIMHLDTLPDDITEEMANDAPRNKLIVNTYKKNAEKYGKTIVFAIKVSHAIILKKLFIKAGIKAEYIVSDIRDSVTGVRISSKENEEKLKRYESGDTQVLINVNILTEGVDLPQTQTVFLARPTVSTILMTQMIGRALRGVSAGGTDYAYIVSFVDDWREHIAWVNPESLFVDDESDFSDNPKEHQKHEIRMIAISKIEEFAAILDDSVDTTAIERVAFEKRIPIGMYAFTCLEENGMDHSYQVMVYDSTKEAYEEMMNALPELFADFGVNDEFVEEDTLNNMANQIEDTFFTGEMIPPYSKEDMIHILMYYAQYEDVPKFYEFKDIDKSKLDVAAIAKHIWDEDMGPKKKAEYVDSIWEETDDNMLRLFFGRKIYFWKQLDVELMKLGNPDIYEDEQNVNYGRRDFEDMTLSEIKEHNPDYEKELRDGAFEKAKNKAGRYVCAKCGLESMNRIPFQVDHIIPMNKGGKTASGNLQILCRRCNAKKGDKL